MLESFPFKKLGQIGSQWQANRGRTITSQSRCEKSHRQLRLCLHIHELGHRVSDQATQW